MSPRVGRRVAAVILFLNLGLGGGTVFAQAGPEPARDGSFFRIVLRGAEWPGLIIGLMSVAAVAIIFEQFRTVRRRTMVPQTEIDAARELIESRRFKDCVVRLAASPTMFSQTLLAGLRQGKLGFAAMRTAAEEAASAWTNRLQRRAEYLHILGNLGPLMGLLGTVLGMIRAFGKMQETHGAYKPDDLAGGIALALVNTFLGLLLAVIALGFFGVCRNRIDSLSTQAAAMAIEVIEHFHAISTAPGVAPIKPPRIEPDAAPRSGVLNPPRPAETVR
jgi:biopolymer transport protein ExbB